MAAFLEILLLGAAIGLFARLLKPGKHRLGLGADAFLGSAGSLAAAYAGLAFGLYVIASPAFFFAAVLGSVFVIVLSDSLLNRDNGRNPKGW